MNLIAMGHPPRDTLFNRFMMRHTFLTGFNLGLWHVEWWCLWTGTFGGWPEITRRTR